jgi:hypothetical protein
MAGTNRTKWMMAAGVAAGGAAAFYFLDRERGHARRAAFATKAQTLGRKRCRRSGQVRTR